MKSHAAVEPRAPLTRLPGAAELARQVASGERSALEVVDEHIRRIEAVNGALNAVVVRLFDEARREAAAVDARRHRRDPLGPLHGVPVTIKDSLDVAGTPSTAGLPSRKDHRAARDCPLVARLRSAGAIVLGKTNVPQLLLYLESDNPLYGRTNNPWDLGRSPGGSSGGEAAIVAAGGSALGIGTDLGGSIRVPAHVCGIHGLKPTSYRLSVKGTFDAELLEGQEAVVDQAGPIARRVEDLELAMAVLAAPGQEAWDASIPPVPWRDPRAVRVAGLRVGICSDDGFLTPAPALRRAVCEAGAALRERGIEVEEFRPPDVAEAMALYFGLLSAGGTAWIDRHLAGNPRDRRVRDLGRLAGLPHAVCRGLAALLEALGQRRLADLARAVGRRPAAAYWELVAARERYRARFLAALERARLDALVCPPSAHPALTHGSSYELTAVASYTMLFNLLGLPAGVVAATRVRNGEECDRPPSRDRVEATARAVELASAGLPVGVQVVARPWREDLVLALMAALEEHFSAQSDFPAIPSAVSSQ